MILGNDAISRQSTRLNYLAFEAELSALFSSGVNKQNLVDCIILLRKEIEALESDMLSKGVEKV